MTVVLNTAEMGQTGAAGLHPIGSKVPVRRTAHQTGCVELRNIPASEVLVLMNHPWEVSSEK